MIISHNLNHDNVFVVIKNRNILIKTFMKHLKFNICSIDCIIEFTKNNEKVIFNNKDKDIKPFIDEIVKTIEEIK